MTEQEIYEAYYDDSQKEWENYELQEKQRVDAIYAQLNRIMQPSKYKRLLRDIDLFGEDSHYVIESLSTKMPKDEFWSDRDIPFKGFSPRLDQTIGCLVCCDCAHGTLWLRVTRSMWLEIGWWM